MSARFSRAVRYPRAWRFSRASDRSSYYVIYTLTGLFGDINRFNPIVGIENVSISNQEWKVFQQTLKQRVQPPCTNIFGALVDLPGELCDARNAIVAKAQGEAIGGQQPQQQVSDRRRRKHQRKRRQRREGVAVEQEEGHGDHHRPED